MASTVPVAAKPRGNEVLARSIHEAVTSVGQRHSRLRLGIRNGRGGKRYHRARYRIPALVQDHPGYCCQDGSNRHWHRRLLPCHTSRCLGIHSGRRGQHPAGRKIEDTGVSRLVRLQQLADGEKRTAPEKFIHVGPSSQDRQRWKSLGRLYGRGRAAEDKVRNLLWRAVA